MRACYDTLNKAWEKLPADTDITAHLNSNEQYMLGILGSYYVADAKSCMPVGCARSCWLCNPGSSFRCCWCDLFLEKPGSMALYLPGGKEREIRKIKRSISHRAVDREPLSRVVDTCFRYGK